MPGWEATDINFGSIERTGHVTFELKVKLDVVAHFMCDYRQLRKMLDLKPWNADDWYRQRPENFCNAFGFDRFAGHGLGLKSIISRHRERARAAVKEDQRRLFDLIF